MTLHNTWLSLWRMLLASARGEEKKEKEKLGTGFPCDAHFSIISFKCPRCFLSPDCFNIISKMALSFPFSLTRLQLL